MESISIEPATVDLARGNDTELRVVARLSNGEEETISDSSDVDIEWEALDPDVAEVMDAGVIGVVRGNRIGNATVRAHLNGNTAWAEVAVSALEVRSSQTHLPPGCNAQLSARLVSPDGSTRDVTTDASLEWTATDDSVATVTGGGLVEATGAGTVVVRAQRGEASAGGRVTVAPLKDTGGLRLIDAGLDAPPADPVELSNGEARLLRAMGVFADVAQPDRNLTDCVTWTSSDEPVAVVDPDGRVTAVGDPLDTATVTAIYDDGMSPLLERDANIRIDGDAITGLSVSAPADSELVQGASTQLAAIASFSGGGSMEVTDAVEWSSSAPAVATVGNDAESAGRVTGIEPGSAQLEAELGGFTGAVSIEVIAAPAAPARLTASAEPNVVLAGMDDPATLCAWLVPNAPDQVITQHAVEFALTEGPAGASLASGTGVGDTVTEPTGSNGGPACVQLDPGDDPGSVTVRAREPDSDLAEEVEVAIVTTFASVFDSTTSRVEPPIQNGSAQPGTVFEAAFANGSNRAFTADPDQVTFCNGGNVINVQQKSPAAGDRLGGGGELDVSVELAGGAQDNGFAIAVELTDPETNGSGFTLAHHFTDPEVPCPPDP
ncbi:MAG: Ig-like domain-containing protein [Halofilum sp. (in: g-proteobacteria)]|nr:Ig-like domain-containing protein [Halofilum sp. (in: g-proteobacteria)]